jgi:hypothetical protein
MTHKGPLNEWFFSVQNYMFTNGVPTEQQFATALSFIDTAVITLIAPNGDLDSLMANAGLYTLQNLKEWLTASTIGGGGNADYEHLSTANKAKVGPGIPNHTAQLQAQKAAFAQLTNKSIDTYKIFLVLKNCHPELRRHVITQADGKPWPNFAAFELFFLAQAAAFDQTAGEAKPSNDQGSNSRDRRIERRQFNPAPRYNPIGGGRGRGGRGNNGGRGNGGRGNGGGRGRGPYGGLPGANAGDVKKLQLPGHGPHCQGLPFQGGRVWGRVAGRRCTGRWGECV